MAEPKGLHQVTALPIPPSMNSSSPNGNPADGHNDNFNHQLAIKLSRALNTVNPNDLLATRVTDLVKQNDVDKFITGMRGDLEIPHILI